MHGWCCTEVPFQLNDLGERIAVHMLLIIIKMRINSLADEFFLIYFIKYHGIIDMGL